MFIPVSLSLLFWSLHFSHCTLPLSISLQGSLKKLHFGFIYFKNNFVIWLGLQYTDCIPCSGVTPPPKQWGVLGMIWSCIWWWGSCSGALGSVEYSFIVITPRFTLTWNHSSIYRSNKFVCKLFVLDRNTWYYITVCKKTWENT